MKCTLFEKRSRFKIFIDFLFWLEQNYFCFVLVWRAQIDYVIDGTNKLQQT